MRRSNAAGWRTPMIVVAIASSACVRPSPGPSAPIRDTNSSYLIERGALASAGINSRNRITTEQLDSGDATSVADAVIRLHPDWLRGQRTRAPTTNESPMVYVNDTFVGGAEQLRMIPVRQAGEIRLLTPSMAFDRLGYTCRCHGGVILVITRAR